MLREGLIHTVIAVLDDRAFEGLAAEHFGLLAVGQFGSDKFHASVLIARDERLGVQGSREAEGAEDSEEECCQGKEELHFEGRLLSDGLELLKRIKTAQTSDDEEPFIAVQCSPNCRVPFL